MEVCWVESLSDHFLPDESEAWQHVAIPLSAKPLEGSSALELLHVLPQFVIRFHFSSHMEILMNEPS
jgi:hypothetical protein